VSHRCPLVSLRCPVVAYGATAVCLRCPVVAYGATAVCLRCQEEKNRYLQARVKAYGPAKGTRAFLLMASYGVQWLTYGPLSVRLQCARAHPISPIGGPLRVPVVRMSLILVAGL
jgi:hypothetical protein